MTDKKISRRTAREQKKKLASVEQPAPINDEHFAWSASEIDHAYSGEWDWDLSPKEVTSLLCLLEESCRLTWQEIKDLRTNSKKSSRQLHHDQPIDSICVEAQQRLMELQVDVESVFRLRHGNLVRVWGYLQGHVFKIIWYDRHHRVCPTEPS